MAKSKNMIAEALRKQLSEDLKLGRELERGWKSVLNTTKMNHIKQDRQNLKFDVQANLSKESDFNFIKIYFLTHFSYHIYQLSH